MFCVFFTNVVVPIYTEDGALFAPPQANAEAVNSLIQSEGLCICIDHRRFMQCLCLR